tara:strand:+ start:244 stop:849 length:606 start_codon:yes stop_codon:yes gene_type:complete
MTNIVLENSLDSNEKPLKAEDKVLPLNVSESKVIYPKTPTDAYEVANKKYVDDNAGGGSSDSNYYWVLNAGFNYGSTGGTKVYAPLNGYIFESSLTSGRNEFQVVVMPHDGYLSKVIVRSEEACGSSVVGLHKSSNNTEIPNSTASNEVTVNMIVDDTSYSFAFGESATVSSGDAVAISFDPTNDANDTIMTAVFILDGST